MSRSIAPLLTAFAVISLSQAVARIMAAKPAVAIPSQYKPAAAIKPCAGGGTWAHIVNDGAKFQLVCNAIGEQQP